MCNVCIFLERQDKEDKEDKDKDKDKDKQEDKEIVCFLQKQRDHYNPSMR